MEYKINKGIVLLEIHGIYLLAADQQARKKCRYIKEINQTAAFIFKQLEKGTNITELIKNIKTEYDIINENILKTNVNSFIQDLWINGYLVKGSISEKKYTN